MGSVFINTDMFQKTHLRGLLQSLLESKNNGTQEENSI